MPVDPHAFDRLQRRVLILGRFNADPYNPASWWTQPPAGAALSSLLYRFTKGGDSDPLRRRIALPEGSAEAVRDRLYEELRPSFREEIYQVELTSGTRLSFTRASVAARDRAPELTRRGVLLYPDSPLMDLQVASGYDLLRTITADLDTYLTYEAEGGLNDLLQLFADYCRQLTNLHPAGDSRPPWPMPPAMTKYEVVRNASGETTVRTQMPAEIAFVLLDGLFSPGVEWTNPTDEPAFLAAAKRVLGPKGPHVIQVLLADFKRLCLSEGSETLKPISAEEDIPCELHSIAKPTNLTERLERFKKARAALNRMGQVLQSNLLLGLLARWLLADDRDDVNEQSEYDGATRDAFLQGVRGIEDRAEDDESAEMEGDDRRVVLIRGRILKDIESRLAALLAQQVPDEATRKRVQGVLRLCRSAYLSQPVFRIEDVRREGAELGRQLLEEALAREAREEPAGRALQTAAEQVGQSLQHLLRGRVMLTAGNPGWRLPVIPSERFGELVLEMRPTEVRLSGVLSAANLKKVLAWGQGQNNPVVREALYQTLCFGDAALAPDQQLGAELDQALAPLVQGAVQFDETIQRTNDKLLLGFNRSLQVVSRVGEAIGGGQASADPANFAALTRAEGVRFAIASLGLRQTQETDAPWQRLGQLTVRPGAVRERMAALLASAQALDEAAARLVAQGGEPAAGPGDWAACQAALTDAQARLEALRPVGAHAGVPLGELAATLASVHDEVQKGQPDTGDPGNDRRAALRAATTALALTVASLAGSDVPAEAIEPENTAIDAGAYHTGRLKILRAYLAEKQDAPDHSYRSRALAFLLCQVVLHIHRRLPMAEQRADLGNLCGLLMQLVRRWDPAQPRDEVRRNFFKECPGILPRFLPLGTLQDLRDIAKYYDLQSKQAAASLRELVADLRGLEYLLAGGLPAGAEVVLVNMAGLDFARAAWPGYLEDAYSLRENSMALADSAMPLALLATRSAHLHTRSDLGDFLNGLNERLDHDRLFGRVVVPPVLVAAPWTTPDDRAGSAGELVRLATVIANLREGGGLGFPTFAVGPPLLLTPPEAAGKKRRAEPLADVRAPYYLLARLCGREETARMCNEAQLMNDPNIRALIHSNAAVSLIAATEPTVGEFVDELLTGEASPATPPPNLGAALFAYLVSLPPRAEIGPPGGRIALRNADSPQTFRDELLLYLEAYLQPVEGEQVPAHVRQAQSQLRTLFQHRFSPADWKLAQVPGGWTWPNVVTALATSVVLSRRPSLSRQRWLAWWLWRIADRTGQPQPVA